MTPHGRIAAAQPLGRIAAASPLSRIAAALALALVAACDDATVPAATLPALPSPAEEACLQRVRLETNADVVLLGSTPGAAGTEVIVGVGPGQARWQCVAYPGGGTSRPMSLTDEGAL